MLVGPAEAQRSSGRGQLKKRCASGACLGSGFPFHTRHSAQMVRTSEEVAEMISVSADDVRCPEGPVVEGICSSSRNRLSCSRLHHSAASTSRSDWDSCYPAASHW